MQIDTKGNQSRLHNLFYECNIYLKMLYNIYILKKFKYSFRNSLIVKILKSVIHGL